jgi:hypothetical protein
MKVNLIDLASNKVSKRVGFSYAYFFLGPLYLLFRLRWEALILIIAYYFLLPIPGLPSFFSWMISRGVDPQFVYNIEGFLLFFKQGWNAFNNYLGILIFAFIHICVSIKADNWLLKKSIKKKKLSPEYESDARVLIYYQVIPYNALLAKDAHTKRQLHEEAEKIWENQNIEYTTTISQKDIQDAKFYDSKTKKVNTVFHKK